MVLLSLSVDRTKKIKKKFKGPKPFVFEKKKRSGNGGFFNPSPGDSRTNGGRPMVLLVFGHRRAGEGRPSTPHRGAGPKPAQRKRERDRARKEGESGLRPLPHATPTYTLERAREVPKTDARPSPPFDAQFGPERERGSAGEEGEGQGGRDWESAGGFCGFEYGLSS